MDLSGWSADKIVRSSTPRPAADFAEQIARNTRIDRGSRIRSLSALRWLTAAGLLLAGDGAALAAQQPGAQPIGAPSPPATPPAPLGPSGRITSWLSVRSEFRGRLEGFS